MKRMKERGLLIICLLVKNPSIENMDKGEEWC